MSDSTDPPVRRLVRSNFTCTFAFSLIGTTLSVFKINTGEVVKLEDKAEPCSYLDAQFLSSTFDSYLLVVTHTEGSLRLKHLTDMSETALPTPPDQFSSCLRICQYRKDIVFGYISVYGTSKKHAICIYDLHQADGSEWNVYMVRRYLGSQADPIWFEFADGKTVFWASLNAIFQTNLDQAEPGEEIILLEQEFDGVADVAVTMLVAGDGKQFGLAVLGKSGKVGIWSVDLSGEQASVDELVVMDGTEGVSIQWSPMGSQLLVVPKDENTEPFFIYEAAPGEWIAEQKALDAAGTSI
jgi:WD40 repeat protein